VTYDREIIRAYVDGELDDLTSARLAREAQNDPDLAAAISAERSLREALGAHFAPILDEPLPPGLTAAIDEGRKVVPLAKARQRRFAFNSRSLRWAGPAMAAALVIALLVPSMSGEQIETRDGLTFASNDLAQALDSQLVADQRQGDKTRVLLSFTDKNGTLCRGFARADISGIACRRDGAWHLRVQRDGVDVSANDYRQASSIDRAIFEAAQGMAAGPALDAEGERSAMSRGWTAQ
jgi:hypothetical protein